MVPGAGLEPARPYERGILNPLCLPISPPGHRGILVNNNKLVLLKRLWRRNPESNRDPRICNPLHSHSAIPPHLELIMNETFIASFEALLTVITHHNYFFKFGAGNEIRTGRRSIATPWGCTPCNDYSLQLLR